MGLPEFTNAPLRKCLNWHPRSPGEDDSREVLQLMSKIRILAQSGLPIVEVMAISIMRGVQPLQYRGHPMWHFNGDDDATHCGRKGSDSTTTLVEILSDLYKGKERSSLASNHGMDFPCTTLPAGWGAIHCSTLFIP